MATCKDCIHYDVCKTHVIEGVGIDFTTFEKMIEKNGCNQFKDRSKFIELPCKVGQELYRVKHLGKGTVTTTSLNANTFWRIVMQGEFGRTVFLTKEEAEKALKEKEEKQ